MQRLAYESYKDLGGAKGSMIMGGPDAFDATSKGVIDELMGSMVEDEAEHVTDGGVEEKKTLT